MDGTSCTVCLDHFASGRDVSAVQCGHVFHVDCLSRWMEDHIRCPQCQQLTTHYDIILKLFISFTDATTAEQLEAMTAKLKHTEQVLAQTQQKMAEMSQEFRLRAMSVLFHCCNSITVLNSSLLFNLTTF